MKGKGRKEGGRESVYSSECTVRATDLTTLPSPAPQATVRARIRSSTVSEGAVLAGGVVTALSDVGLLAALVMRAASTAAEYPTGRVCYLAYMALVSH
eukprot:6579366-Prymnesium_polylepis.2